MDSDTLQPVPWAKHEFAKLADDADELELVDIKKRLQALLARVVAAEEWESANNPRTNGCSASSSKGSNEIQHTVLVQNIVPTSEQCRVDKDESNAAARLFNIYEHAKMVLEQLPFKSLVQAQNITRTTQNVTRTSHRILKCHSKAGVYTEPWVSCEETAAFERRLDFDSMSTGCPYLLLTDTSRWKAWDHTKGYDKKILTLTYDVNYGLKPSRFWSTYRKCYHALDSKKRSVVCPRPTSVTQGEGRPRVGKELWRNAAWSHHISGVEITLKGKDAAGRLVECTGLFRGDITIGETYDWMGQVAEGNNGMLEMSSAWSREYIRHSPEWSRKDQDDMMRGRDLDESFARREQGSSFLAYTPVQCLC